MRVWQFILAYVIMTLLFPILEKVSELAVSIMQIFVTKVAIRLHELQSEIPGASTTSSGHAIGFQYEVEDEVEEE